MTNDGVKSYVYNAENMLISATQAGVTSTLSYDALNRLASITKNGITTKFIYDGSELIAEYNSVGSVLRKYVHSTRDDDPQIWLEGAGNGDIRHVYANYQGSVVATTNAAGSAVQIYKYGPYGEPKDGAGNLAWNGFRFRYTGQQILPEAKLYYYKARVYDPNRGVFLQADPIGTKDDLNLYAYVGGDVINKTDPDGMQAAMAACAGGPLLCLVGGAITAVQAGALIGGGIAGAVISANQANEEQRKNDPAIGELTNGAKPGDKTKGKSKIFEKPGGIDAANEDFDNIVNPDTVKDRGNGVRQGKTAAGNPVIVRPSKDGRPTVEVQKPNKVKIKVRYNE